MVHYLEKENRATPEKVILKELWFNNTSGAIIPEEVRVKIDNNIARLGKKDAKFFLLNISPIQKEITYLKERFGNLGQRRN